MAPSCSAGGGNDTITGSEAGDTIFGGDGFDTIDGGGTTSDDGDVLVGGGGNDTFNMSSTSLSDSIIVGGTGTDEVLYDGYAGDITFNITSGSVSTTHDSTVSEAITGVEQLLGVSNASYTNTFNFSGDTTSQGVLAVNGGVNDDTFNLTSGSTTAMDIDAEAGDDIFNIGANAAFTGTTITGGSGNDTFNVSALALDGATRAFNGGSNAADILNITASSDVNLSATEMNGATLFETFRFQSGVNYNVTLGANNIANGASTSITASGSTSMVLDAELETDGDFGYTGSAGTDQLTVATAMLDDNNSHSLNGNTGTDTIYFAGTAATNLDATEIGSVVNFENWVLDDDANYTFTLGSGNATTATFTINATTVTTQTVTIDATAESSETIDYTGGTGIDQLTVSRAMLFAANNNSDAAILNGGGGSSDILTINGTGTLSSAALANISGWETWTLTGAAKNFTTVDGNFASGITTTVSASSMTGNVDLNASAETDGTLSYSGSAGIDTVIGGDGADILVGNNGDDVFTGGDGGDTLTGNVGNDTFTYTAITDGASANSVSGYDTITDFVAGSESFTISGTFATAIDDVTADSSLTWGTVSGSPVALDFSGTKEAIRIDTAAGLSVGDLTTSGWSSVLSVINTGNTITSASGIDALILANDGTNSAFYYYLENGSVTTTVEASELSLVAFASNATMTETDVDLA